MAIVLLEKPSILSTKVSSKLINDIVRYGTIVKAFSILVLVFSEGKRSVGFTFSEYNSSEFSFLLLLEATDQLICSLVFIRWTQWNADASAHFRNGIKLIKYFTDRNRGFKMGSPSLNISFFTCNSPLLHPWQLLLRHRDGIRHRESGNHFSVPGIPRAGISVMSSIVFSNREVVFHFNLKNLGGTADPTRISF